MKKILFLHGFFATGSCPMATVLKESLETQAIVLTPDLPLHPKEALQQIRTLIDRERPELLIGNSCGAFLAQMLSPIVGIPALLGNPHFSMSHFLRERIGEHTYKYPRKDGNQRILIDDALIEEFQELESTQFDCCSSYYMDKVWGLFGASNQLLAVLALLAVSAWLGNMGKSNRMLYIPMMFMLAATLTSLLFSMGNRIGDLTSGFDGVAAVQLVISAILFIMAVFLMAEGLKVLNSQRLTKRGENA